MWNDPEQGGGRRMKRKLFTFAASLSAVLCVGVCTLWVRSYQAGDVWTLAIAADGDRRVVASERAPWGGGVTRGAAWGPWPGPPLATAAWSRRSGGGSGSSVPRNRS